MSLLYIELQLTLAVPNLKFANGLCRGYLFAMIISTKASSTLKIFTLEIIQQVYDESMFLFCLVYVLDDDNDNRFTKYDQRVYI